MLRGVSAASCSGAPAAHGQVHIRRCDAGDAPNAGSLGRKPSRMPRAISVTCPPMSRQRRDSVSRPADASDGAAWRRRRVAVLVLVVRPCCCGYGRPGAASRRPASARPSLRFAGSRDEETNSRAARLHTQKLLLRFLRADLAQRPRERGLSRLECCQGSDASHAGPRTKGVVQYQRRGRTPVGDRGSRMRRRRRRCPALRCRCATFASANRRTRPFSSGP
jgi:hypothetical protein